MPDNSIKRKFLFIEDRQDRRERIREAFGGSENCVLQFVDSPIAARDIIRSGIIDAVFFRRSLCGPAEMESLQTTGANGPKLPLIMTGEKADLRSTQAAIGQGASDVVPDDARSINAFPVIAECAIARTAANGSELERLKKLFGRVHKLASVGLLVTDAAHEINNPLTGTIAYSELLIMKASDEEVQRDVAKILQSAERCKRVIDNLATFTRQRTPSRSVESINGIINRVVDLRAYSFASRGIRVESNFDDNTTVFADPGEIQQVILDVLMNAQEAIAESGQKGGVIKITTNRIQENGLVSIRIADSGPGIPPALISRIFEPFSTSRSEKAGLGLSLCRDIVTENGGTIRAENGNEGGAAITIELPSGSGSPLHPHT